MTTEILLLRARVYDGYTKKSRDKLVVIWPGIRFTNTNKNIANLLANEKGEYFIILLKKKLTNEERICVFLHLLEVDQ